MTSDHLHKAEQGYDAFSRGDWAALAPLLDPDVQWFVGGNSSLSGRYGGRDQMLDYFRRLLRAAGGSFSVDVLALTEPIPRTVIALLHVHAEVDGRVFDEDAVHQVEFRRGLAVNCRMFLQNGHLFDALVGPALVDHD